MGNIVLSWLPYPEALLAVAVSLLLFIVINRRRRDIPIDWPVLGMLPGLLSNVHRVHEFATDVLAASGCTALIKGPWGGSMDILITADPANVNHIFSANFANYPKGADFGEIFDILGGGIFNADADDWKMQRKLTHGFMAEQRFRRFVVDTSRMKVEKGLLPVLEKAAGDGTPVDLQDLFLRFTFDTTCILVMGLDPGCLSLSLPDVPFADAMDDAEEILLLRHVFPVPLWKLLRRLNLFQERRLSQAWRTMDLYVHSHVAGLKESLHKSTLDDPKLQQQPSPHLLSSFLHQSHSDVFLRDTAVNLLLAGRDTTASGLSWFFYLVASNPHVQDKILEELRSQDVSCSDGVVPEAEELGKLVYLHAALLETLRLYPPVPFEHKRASKEDVLPSGHRVTPEMRVVVSLYAMGRMEGVWGKDCKEYKPERWINERGRLRHEPSYKFMAFNSGPRTCLGKDIALMQMKAVAAAVLRRYEVEVVEGQRVQPKVSILLHMKDGLMVRIGRRAELDFNDKKVSSHS